MGLLFLATLQHIQSSSKSERDTCVISLVSLSIHLSQSAANNC